MGIIFLFLLLSSINSLVMNKLSYALSEEKPQFLFSFLCKLILAFVSSRFKYDQLLTSQQLRSLNISHLQVHFII